MFAASTRAVRVATLAPKRRDALGVHASPRMRFFSHFLAVASGVWDYPAGVAQAVADFNTTIADALPFDRDLPVE